MDETMKILYAIQGTGNGHISRARDIIPALQDKYDLDILISGTQAEVDLLYPVKYRFKGLSFIFGKTGGVDFMETYRKSNLRVLFEEIHSLETANYDLVINDFEPVSSWSCLIHNIPCIALSHQVAVLNKKAPQPGDIDPLGKAILANYAPSTVQYGFHFRPYDRNIFTPVIRSEIRERKPKNKGHYTVYLPAWDDKIVTDVLTGFDNVRWQVFSKHNSKVISEKNVLVRPIDNKSFIESLVTSEGVLCGAGFETPAEALYLKKKLMVIPMKGQYEQLCNAAALKEMGVPVIKSFKPDNIEKLWKWIRESEIIQVDYPDITKEIIEIVIHTNPQISGDQNTKKLKKFNSFKRFRNKLVKNITAQLKA